MITSHFAIVLTFFLLNPSFVLLYRKETNAFTRDLDIIFCKSSADGCLAAGKEARSWKLRFFMPVVPVCLGREESAVWEQKSVKKKTYDE